MSGDHDRIGPTAHYTAYVWRRLGLPYADAFATRTGAVLYWGFFAAGEWMTRLSPGVPSMADYLEYRHRLIDAVVEQVHPDRLVDLGAGLSRRGITWAAQRGVDCIDVDLPHMAAVKRQALRRLTSAETARLCVVDDDVVAEGFEHRLATLLKGSHRPLVTAEGLLSYFDLPDRIAVIGSVAAALRTAGGGTFVCDLHTAEDQARVGTAARMLRLAIRGVTRRRRAIDPFESREAMRTALTGAGFDTMEIVDAARYVQQQPRLAVVRSPALVVRADVRAPVSPGASA